MSKSAMLFAPAAAMGLCYLLVWVQVYPVFILHNVPANQIRLCHF